VDPNRINQTSIVTSLQRQTPKDDFGSVMAQTIAQGVKTGASILGGVLGNPATSAAVSAVNAVAGVVQVGPAHPQVLAGGSIASAASTVTGATSPLGATGTGTGSGWDLLAAQQAMQSDSQNFNMQYLALQDQMQRESREFTAVSNIMKVRQDSAKNAINNIH
jgi:hypothetical protein